MYINVHKYSSAHLLGERLTPILFMYLHLHIRIILPEISRKENKIIVAKCLITVALCGSSLNEVIYIWSEIFFLMRTGYLIVNFKAN